MKHKKAQKKRGPVADRVVINTDWKSAVGKALKKKRPESGWPDEKKPKE